MPGDPIERSGDLGPGIQEGWLRGNESISEFAHRHGLRAQSVYTTSTAQYDKRQLGSFENLREDHEAQGIAPCRIFFKKKVPLRVALTLSPGSTAKKSIKLPTAEPICPFCNQSIEPGQPPHIRRVKGGVAHNDKGFSKGDSGLLGKAIRKERGWKAASDHPWYITSHAIEAHHLLSSEIFSGNCAKTAEAKRLEEEETALWSLVCNETGFNINNAGNGVFLPKIMALACHLAVPLHYGNHSFTKDPYYPNEVYKLARKALEKLFAGDFCPNAAQGLRDYLQEQAVEVAKKLSGFRWRLTIDGLHYQSGKNTIGCGDCNKLADQKYAKNTDDEYILK